MAYSSVLERCALIAEAKVRFFLSQQKQKQKVKIKNKRRIYGTDSNYFVDTIVDLVHTGGQHYVASTFQVVKFKASE